MGDIPLVAFRVPNTATGSIFLKLARKYVNRDRYSSVNARPRGNRSKHRYDSERKGCKSYGVYLMESDAIKQERRAAKRKQDKEHAAECDAIRKNATEAIDKVVRSGVVRMSEQTERAQSWDREQSLERAGMLREINLWKLAAGITFLIGIAVGIITTGTLV